jgi:hypothetical protein
MSVMPPLETSSPPASFLAKLAPMSAGGWHALGAQIYPGELSVATDNSVYRFKGGVFLGRARKNARTFDVPKEMRGLRLVGFLHDEGGLWSLSPRWREGAHAVLWKPSETEEQAFLLTSRTREFTIDEPAPAPDRTASVARMRRPIPGSTTRIHAAALSH